VQLHSHTSLTKVGMGREVLAGWWGPAKWSHLGWEGERAGLTGNGRRGEGGKKDGLRQRYLGRFLKSYGVRRWIRVVKESQKKK